jgi:hypothetical protein
VLPFRFYEEIVHLADYRTYESKFGMWDCKWIFGTVSWKSWWVITLVQVVQTTVRYLLFQTCNELTSCFTCVYLHLTNVCTTNGLLNLGKKWFSVFVPLVNRHVDYVALSLQQHFVPGCLHFELKYPLLLLLPDWYLLLAD